MSQPGRSTSPNPALVAAFLAALLPAGSLAAAADALPAPAPTPSGPQILYLSATPAVVHGGQSVVWDVRTTPDVVSVDARVSLYALQLHRRSPGRFFLSFQVPRGLPWFFHGNYRLDVRAHSAQGAIVHRSISLDFQ